MIHQVINSTIDEGATNVIHAHDGKMIPMISNAERGFLCRICEEVWMKGISRQ